MGNLFTYLEEYGQYSFAEKPFNSVDMLVLSELAYVSFDDRVPDIMERKASVTMEWLGKNFVEPIEFTVPFGEKEGRKFWQALFLSRRFKTMKANLYSSIFGKEVDSQFAAITFFPEGELPVIAFRGTDSTFAGWKEDFNMALEKPVPSQTISGHYVNAAARMFLGEFRICGHSKGGNLAIYSAMKADPDVRSRIVEICSFDGPGFHPEVLECEEYKEIVPKIKRFIPHSSLVGMLMESSGDYMIIESRALGLFQHDGFSWNIEEGAFVQAKDIETHRKLLHEALNQWIFTLSEEETKLFLDALYQVIDAAEVETIPEFVKDAQGALKRMNKAMKGLDKETVKRIRGIIKALFTIAGDMVKQEIKKIIPGQTEGTVE